MPTHDEYENVVSANNPKRFSSNQDAPAPNVKPSIISEVALTTEASAHLMKSLEELEQALTPILRPSVPSASPERANEEAVRNDAKLLTDTHMNLLRLYRMNEKVRSILNSIQL